MSVFRIQKKRVQHDSRHKIHSQQSKQYTYNIKNITQILNSTQSKQLQSPKFQLKRRIFTLQGTQPDYQNHKLKRISEAYNVNFNKNQFLNSRSSGKSLTKDKIFPTFQQNKKSQGKINPYQGISRSSPKLEGAVYFNYKSNQKVNMKSTSKSKQFLEKRKTQFGSLNSSFHNKNSGKKLLSTRKISQQQQNQTQKVYRQACKQYKLKNTQKALNLFKQVNKRQPQNLDCLYYIGSCYLNLGQIQKSVKYLKEVLLLNPTYHQNIYLYLSINYKKLKKDSQAIKILIDGIRNYPNFQQGYFYIGKLQLKNQRYNKALIALQKCVYLNENNLLAKILIGDIYRNMNQDQKAIQMYKSILYKEQQLNEGIKTIDQSFISTYRNSTNIQLEKNTARQIEQKMRIDQKTKKATHLKLIRLLIGKQDYNSISLKNSINYLTLNHSQDPELIYFKCFLSYQLQSHTPQLLSSLKVNLQLLLNQFSSSYYELSLDCIILLFKIYIDSKDMYGAEQLINRCTRLNLKQDHLSQWKLLIEGANDIIKRKFQQGKNKLQKCQSKICQKQEKNKATDKDNLNPTIKGNNKIFNYSLKSQDIKYIKFNIQEYLAYTYYIFQKYEDSFGMYQKLCRSQQFLPLRKKYSEKFKQLQISRIVLEALIQHKQKQNFSYAKKLLKTVLQQRQNPECLFMWVINQISILRKFQNQISSDRQQQNVQPQFQFDWNLLGQKILRCQEIAPRFSLIYFYHALLDLHLQNYADALQRVQKAIQTIQQPVSEYHFIQALCYYLIAEDLGDIEVARKGLLAIDRAIQIDNTIPQFFKQRSKHLFCLQKYGQAIIDCQKCIHQGQQDEQAKLLSMFYNYLADNYHISQKILVQLVYDKKSQQKKRKQSQAKQDLISDIDHKYKQFEQALMFRLGKYQKTGLLQKIFVSLANQQKKVLNLDQKYIELISAMIQNRNQYSQFTIYFVNLLMAVYYAHLDDHNTSLNHLFSCLQEIQFIIDEKNKKMQSENMSQHYGQHSSTNSKRFVCMSMKDQVLLIDTDQMLNQVKHNIVITTLLKNHSDYKKLKQNPDSSIENISQKIVFPPQVSSKMEVPSQFSKYSAVYAQTITFIDTFIKQSQSEQLIQNLQLIKKLVQQSQIKNKDASTFKENDIPVQLKPFLQVQKFSDLFPQIQIPIGDKYLLKTKFVVFYPAKLRFNIKPQFDPSFLFNFDIDKVQNKLVPPWFKFSQANTNKKNSNRMIFTDQLRNQSINLSQTQRQPSRIQSIKDHRKSRNRYQKSNKNDSKNQLEIGQSLQFKRIRDLKNVMKLDSMIQKKLKKLFPN